MPAAATRRTARPRLPRPAEGPERLTGTLERIRYQGQAFWSIADLRTTAGSVCIKGKLPAARAGETLEITGRWVEDPKWGKQFEIATVRQVAAADAAGVVAWLHGALPGIGRTRAAAIVERWGAGEPLWVIVKDHPELLTAIPGITAEMAQKIGEAYRAQEGRRSVMVDLKRYGLTDHQCALVLERYGADAPEVLRRDPYRMTAEIAGFGFVTVDQLALSAGVPRDSLERGCSAIRYLLEEARQQGHVYLPWGELRAQAIALLEVSGETASEALAALSDGSVVVEEGQRGRRIYLRTLWQAEQQIAAALGALQAAAGDDEPEAGPLEPGDVLVAQERHHPQ